MRLVTPTGAVRTSLAIEPEFWAAIAAEAKGAGVSLPVFIAQIRDEVGERALASAVRVRCLTALQQRHGAAPPTPPGDHRRRQTYWENMSDAERAAWRAKHRAGINRFKQGRSATS